MQRLKAQAHSSVLQHERHSGASRCVTSNTIPHESGSILTIWFSSMTYRLPLITGKTSEWRSRPRYTFCKLTPTITGCE
jgi:hypothetical protein